MGAESSGPLAGLWVLEVAGPLRLTDYTSQVVCQPPGSGEHDEDVFRDWLS